MSLWTYSSKATVAASSKTFNPLITNGFAHHCNMGESTFILRGIRCDFKFSYKFLKENLLGNKTAPDGWYAGVTSGDIPFAYYENMPMQYTEIFKVVKTKKKSEEKF